MTAVIDASVAIAALLNEPGSETANRAIAGSVISAVNYSEIIALLVRRGLSDEGAILAADSLGLTVIPFTGAEAVTAGILIRETQTRGLSLGDRACLALALSTSSRAVTADRAWAGLELGVDIEVIR